MKDAAIFVAIVVFGVALAVLFAQLGVADLFGR